MCVAGWCDNAQANSSGLRVFNICYLLRGRLLVYIAPLFPAGIINCGNDTHADTKQYEKSEKDIDVFHIWICCLFAKKI